MLESYTSVYRATTQSIANSTAVQTASRTWMDFTIPLAAVAPSNKAIDPTIVQQHMWAYAEGSNM